jgi:hypothetical protein
MRGKKKSGAPGTVRVSIRIGLDVLGRAARLEDHVGHRLGARASRADVFRQALMRGLALLEGEPTERGPPRRPRQK